MHNPKISIIVPIYNAERFIDRCMASIYAQTFTDYEVILINDGSTDNSYEICRNYASKDERIIVIAKENGGAGSARNKGIEVATGEYLAFPDVDDWFGPEMYADLYRTVQERDYDVIFSGVNYYKQTKDGLEYFKTENIKSVSYNTMEDCRKHIMDFFPTTTIFDVPWNKLYKRSVIIDNNIRFSDLRRCQDAMFNVDFFNCINSIRSLDKAFYNYMQNTTADVQRKFPKNYIDICISYYTHLISVLESWNVYNGFIREHYDTSFILAIHSCVNMYDNPWWNLSRKEQREYVTNCISRSEVTAFIPYATIRNNELDIFKMIKNNNTTALMRRHKIELMKETLRRSRFLRIMWRGLKSLK